MKSGLRRAVLAIVFASVPGVVGVAGAQVAAGAGVGEGTSGSQCYQTAATGTVSCRATAPNGATQSATATSTLTTRTLSASASSSGAYPNAYPGNTARGFAGFNDYINVPSPNLGVSQASSIVFRYAMSLSASTNGGFAFAQFFVKDGYVRLNGNADGTTSLTLSNAVATPTGYDFRFPFNQFVGGYAYNSSSLSVIMSNGRAGDAQSAGIDARLSGIDALDAEGNIVRNATFDENGHATISFFGPTSTVPEPGSLALLATGLIGLAPFLRRSRRR